MVSAIFIHRNFSRTKVYPFLCIFCVGKIMSQKPMLVNEDVHNQSGKFFIHGI